MRHPMLALAVPALIGLAACGGSDDATPLEATEVGTVVPEGDGAADDAATAGATDAADARVLGEVVAADGWEVEETESERDEVEIEFRREGEELDFGAELDDSTLQVQVCADDD